MKNRFIYIEEWGELYIDKILFEVGYPVLFTCINDMRDLFVCVCCRNNEDGAKWLISRTTAGSIIQMLKNKISLRDIFLCGEGNRYSVNSFENKIDIIKNDDEDWGEDSIYLPKKNEYMDAEEDEYKEELLYYGCFDIKYTLSNLYFKDHEMVFDIPQDTMQLPDIMLTMNAEDSINAFPGKIVKVYIVVENMKLNECNFKDRMAGYYYRNVLAGWKNTSDVYEFTSKQKDIFGIESELDTDLLEAA